ncbi:MAG: deoxyguanosinetriphosphate triphosphohydrolase [Sphingomonadales bacterium]
MMNHAPQASDPAISRGRQHFETLGEVRGPRTAFQRDRDRIVHSIAFRRLRHKTQVFVAPDGDHFRVRLTHSLEVSQIGRTIARALGLDEDLTEALCLAHDIGHPPFGHAGEDALKAAMADVGGFDHNGHTLRVLTQIEAPYPRWRGLNLSWETLEGLAKHNGPVSQPGWALSEVDAAFPLELQSHAGLEAQVAAIADDIAYDNHDIDDGLRSGILDFDAVTALPFVARGWADVLRRYPDVPPRRLRPELIRQQIGVMVNDVISETRLRIGRSGASSASDVRSAPAPLVGFSKEMAEDERVLKRFMYAELYHHPRQIEVAEQASVLIAGLFAAYRATPDLLSEEWRETLPESEPGRSRHIGDFIAGMTDRYAISRYREFVGPVEMPEGF